MKLGSLFDGSGGFPLAGSLCGIEPVWAAEVEPYPIAVTRSRFPKMKHLGSVTDINGAEVEPVDIITFGSPCQDLSVAGKRAGLKHEDNGDEETTRSGLFMEAVRIIKEMREATNGEYPTFALWENVPGAFSSNKGEDFRIVLEELIKIVEPSAVMPAVPQSGWPYADSYCGDGWSLAYRVFDAQYWGVPQRRRRIYLVADFRGERARSVLFERKGLRGYFEKSSEQREEVARNVGNSVETANREGDCITSAGGFKELNSAKARSDGFGYEVAPCLAANKHDACVAYTLKIRSGCEGGGKGALVQTDKSATLATNNDQYLFQPITFEPGIARREGGHVYEGVCGTLRANMGDNQMAVAYSAGFCPETGGNDPSRSVGLQEELSPTLRAGVTPAVVYSIENHPADSRVNIDESGKVQTLTSRMGTGGGKGALIQEDLSATLATNNDQYLFQPVCYGISSYESNAMKSSNPHSGVYEAQTSRTLDLNGGNPACNQGGIAIVESVYCPSIAYLASGKEAVGTLMANAGTKLWLGNQEAFSGDYHIIEEHDVVPYGVDSRNATEYEEMTGALQADAAHNLNSNNVVRVRYIVRRLTPTECARLQGFADRWGDIEEKTDFTDEEYAFWLDVRNTHAAINGKPVKEYTKDQMLTWYNKLHTDSAEYKMWGNGIALPTALYCMQGIAEAMR